MKIVRILLWLIAAVVLLGLIAIGALFFVGKKMLDHQQAFACSDYLEMVPAIDQLLETGKADAKTLDMAFIMGFLSDYGFSRSNPSDEKLETDDAYMGRIDWVHAVNEVSSLCKKYPSMRIQDLADTYSFKADPQQKAAFEKTLASVTYEQDAASTAVGKKLQLIYTQQKKGGDTQ